jgi:S-formylglutathione hydrolase FrmB
MILSHCNFYSKTLCNHTDIQVLLPTLPDNDHIQKSLKDIYAERRIPALYLLHGALDDYTMWLRQTNVERYAEEAGIAVIMPSGHNGYYTNARYGLRYFDYITIELPYFIQYTFPVARAAEYRFIAGASMGGYGACKCALSLPDQYRAFGNFSGAVDPERLEPLMKEIGFDFFRYDLIFGGSDKVKGSADDLMVLAERNETASKKPFAFISCGKEDRINTQMNLDLYEKLTLAGFETELMRGAGGHDWAYWDKCLKRFIEKISSLKPRE